VIELLQIEINKRDLRVSVSALVNDAVATLMAHSYSFPSEESSFIGAIFGMGTNGAYLENIDEIPKLQSVDGPKSMVINTEWAAFDNKVSQC
jgi:hexokinase